MFWERRNKKTSETVKEIIYRDWSYRNPQRTTAATTKAIKESQKQPKVILFHDTHKVIETMELFVKWMEEHHYQSEAITPQLSPIKIGKKLEGAD